MDCKECGNPMTNRGVYKFESEKDKRGLFGAIFDIEEHLKFEVHSCTRCDEVRLKFKGSRTVVD